MKDDRESRLRGESIHKITQHEIDAWKRGNQDALKSSLLKKKLQVPVEKVVRFIKMFADFGDIYRAVTKLDISMEEAKKILSAFNINSVEDARHVVNFGIVKEYEDASMKEIETSRANDIFSSANVEERLAEHERQMRPQAKDQEQINEALGKLKQEAIEKNKKDKIRQLISEGVNPQTNRSGFRIGIGDVSAFKSMIPQGVSILQRHFGGTKQDIVAEIKRLAPHYNIDLLRP